MGAAPGRHAQLTAAGADVARAYAQRLLDDLGATPRRPLATIHEHPALAWARSGLMALTGLAEGQPQMCPAPLASCADGVLAALAALAPDPCLGTLRGSQLLAERAAMAGYTRAGPISPGGSCRLLPTADGVLALNLAREDDWALLPAWLEIEVVPAWDALAQAIKSRKAAELVQRGRLLGLAVAQGNVAEPGLVSWFAANPTATQATAEGHAARQANDRSRPRVVDLSSLWAGPLCSHLLQQLGAEVIKVESTQRPDGARQGTPAFFDLLNAGKRCVALDFATTQGRGQLRDLIRSADIVIEGSRPRALRQLGFHAEALIEENPGLSWISLSGYGRGQPQEDWIAFGDDAAVAAGLSEVQYRATGQHLIVGDAIADPLTGMHAALVAWASHASGGGQVVSLALRDVVRQCLYFDLPDSLPALRERHTHWSQLAQGEVMQPQVRLPQGRAAAQGQDNAAVLRALGCAC